LRIDLRAATFRCRSSDSWSDFGLIIAAVIIPGTLARMWAAASQADITIEAGRA
jgi:hypothetical protein